MDSSSSFLMRLGAVSRVWVVVLCWGGFGFEIFGIVVLCEWIFLDASLGGF